MVLVEISHFESINHFFVRLEKNKNDFINITEAIKKAYKNFEWTPTILEVGYPTIVKYDNNIILRANILAIKDEKYTVQFVDYGHTDTVDFKCVFPLGKQFRSVCEQAVKCKLVLKRGRDQDHAYYFRTGDQYYCKFLHKIEMGYYLVQLMPVEKDQQHLGEPMEF